MKGKPTHYYCYCTDRNKPKNKLQAEFLALLEELNGDLYEANRVDVLKAYILESAKEINEKHSRCTPLHLSFEDYTTENFYLVGFEVALFQLKAAYLINASNV